MISRFTAMTIHGDDVNVEPFLNENSRKYGYIISRRLMGDYSTVLEVRAVYDTEDDSRAAGEELVQKIKDMDLSKLLA